MIISKKIRLDILKALLSEEDFFGYPLDDFNIIKLLDQILNLKSLPSEDTRFSNAYDDALQHLVNNNDWDYEYVLTERFNIIEDPKTFILFLNKIIHPDIRKREDNIIKYYLLINPYLEKEGLSFVIESYNHDGLSIYEVSEIKDSQPSTIKENNIPFYINYDDVNFYLDNKGNYLPEIVPPQNNCFVLIHKGHWNDFGNYSSFYLFYYKDNLDCFYIGNVKIINRDAKDTKDVLKERFTILNSDYCSLGQEYEYYENLKTIFDKNFTSVLWALKDSAFFPDVLEDFENLYYFKNSLIRFDEQEQLLREVRFRLYDYNLKNLYSFKYSFKPKYIDEPIDVHFDFDSNRLVPNRIIAIIGKNGIGKTQLISSLPLDISKKNDKVFTPKTPLFSKVISVSYSVFDSFEIPRKTSDFNYVYCGLKDIKGEFYSEKGLKLRFHNSWKKIIKNRRFDQWFSLLPFFLNKELIDEFVKPESSDNDFKVDLKGFTSVSKKLSSGQSILLYIITEIVANIRYDSLLIYDEPETHLHPNAISQLINAIHSLTAQFQSYCIIATHSPIIIRELLSNNVFIMEKEGKVLSLRKPINETFGENLTVITEDIFGNNEIPNLYKSILQNLVSLGKTYEEIISLISSDNIPMSLNTRIFLKSIIDEKSKFL